MCKHAGLEGTAGGAAHPFLEPVLGRRYHGIHHGHAYVGLHLLIKYGRQRRHVSITKPSYTANGRHHMPIKFVGVNKRPEAGQPTSSSTVMQVVTGKRLGTSWLYKAAAHPGRSACAQRPIPLYLQNSRVHAASRCFMLLP